MEVRDRKFFILIMLALVFTIAFTFLTLEAPKTISDLFPVLFPDYNPAFQHDLIEELMTYLRPVGYGCMLIVVVLTVIGFKKSKEQISLIGSVAFFLPTFGYYVIAMFFLTSIGILRLLWLPFWDVSSDLIIFKLGDVSYIPYMITIYCLEQIIHVDVRVNLAYAVISLGIFIFFLGTATWFVGKNGEKTIINFWIYKYSRHPQYLGFLIWSYGVLLLATLSTFPRGGYYHRPSLPWLISSMIIVSIALKEEIVMKNKHGKEYNEYQQKTPFMFPLPKSVSSIINAPILLIFKKRRLETGYEILFIFTFYTTILILLSLPFYLLNWPPGFGWFSWPYI